MGQINEKIIQIESNILEMKEVKILTSIQKNYDL